MRVLVTGSSSLIGRCTVARLAERGDVVTTLQRSPSGIATGALSREVLGSITDRDVVARACEGQDAIVHLAAKVGVTGDWDEFKSVNVTGTTRLLDAARRAGVRRFVHVSSPSVAHSGHALVGARATPADPSGTRGHYATSKASAELVALDASNPDLPVVAIRPHLVWGPGDTQLVGRIVERARRGRLVLVGSGTALIDTTYADNAADAIVAALDRADRLEGHALVVSNGEPRSVHEIVARIVDAAGIAWSPRRIPARIAIAGGTLVERWWGLAGRTDDPPMTGFLAEQLSTAHWFDQRHARAALEWEPAVTLADGFERLAAWYRHQPT